MTHEPIHDADAPITCTIGEDDVPERVALVERLRTGLDCVERTEHGLLLHFPTQPAIEVDLRRLAVQEKACCQFWGFAVDATTDELTLRWDGRPAAGALLDQLHDFFAGDEPFTGISGLL